MNNLINISFIQEQYKFLFKVLTWTYTNFESLDESDPKLNKILSDLIGELTTQNSEENTVVLTLMDFEWDFLIIVLKKVSPTFEELQQSLVAYLCKDLANEIENQISDYKHNS